MFASGGQGKWDREMRIWRGSGLHVRECIFIFIFLGFFFSMEKWQELEAYLLCTPLALPGVGEEQMQKWVSDTGCRASGINLMG